MECKVDIKQVEDFASALYTENTVKGISANEQSNSVTVRRYLNIHQKGILLLVTPMDLILYYPIIAVEPTLINFGNVWIGNNSRATFTIYNYSGIIARQYNTN